VIRSAKLGLAMAALLLVASFLMPARQVRDVPWEDPLCYARGRVATCPDQLTHGSFYRVVYGGGRYGRR